MTRWRTRLPALVAGAIVASIVVLAVCADWVVPAGPNDQDITARLKPPALARGQLEPSVRHRRAGP